MALTDQTISFTTQQVSSWVYNSEGAYGASSTLLSAVFEYNMYGGAATLSTVVFPYNMYGGAATLFGGVFGTEMYGGAATRDTTEFESPYIEADIIHYGEEAHADAAAIVLANNVVLMAAYPIESWGAESYSLNVIEPIGDITLGLDDSSSIIFNTNAPSGTIITLPSLPPNGARYTFINTNGSGIVIDSVVHSIKYHDELGSILTGYNASLNIQGAKLTLIADDNHNWIPILEQDVEYLGMFPEEIDGLSLWLDASDTSTLDTSTAYPDINRWDDKSGNGINLSQSATVRKPHIGTLVNGLNTVTFDGIDDFLVRTPAPFTGASGDFFAVIKHVGGGGRYYFGSYEDTSSWVDYLQIGNSATQNYIMVRRDAYNQFYTTEDPVSQTQLANWLSDGTSYSVYIDGEIRTFNIVGGSDDGKWFDYPVGLQNLSVGALGPRANGYTSSWYNGNVCEILYYDNKVLSDSERASISKHLIDKWGI